MCYAHSKRMWILPLLGEMFYEYQSSQRVFSRSPMSSLILFCLVVLPSAERGMLKSPTTIVEMSLSPFNPASFLLHDFDVLLLVPIHLQLFMLSCWIVPLTIMKYPFFHPRFWCEICYYLILTDTLNLFMFPVCMTPCFPPHHLLSTYLYL